MRITHLLGNYVKCIFASNIFKKPSLSPFYRDLSPRSAAEYVKKKLKEDAAKRKKKKRRKQKRRLSKSTDVKVKKKKKRRRKVKRKKRRRTDEAESGDEFVGKSKQKPLGPQDEHFYPTPRSLFKKRVSYWVTSFKIYVNRHLKNVSHLVRFYCWTKARRMYDLRR